MESVEGNFISVSGRFVLSVLCYPSPTPSVGSRTDSYKQGGAFYNHRKEIDDEMEHHKAVCPGATETSDAGGAEALGADAQASAERIQVLAPAADYL